MGKETIVAYSKLLSQHSPEGTEEKYEHPQSVELVSGRNSNWVGVESIVASGNIVLLISV
jgi:hypothetical protein